MMSARSVLCAFARSVMISGGFSPAAMISITAGTAFLITLSSDLIASSRSVMLVTPVARRHFDPQGLPVPTHGAYPEAIRRLARSRYDEIVSLIGKDEFTADPMGAYENRIYCKSAPMKTAVVWNGDYIDPEL